MHSFFKIVKQIFDDEADTRKFHLIFGEPGMVDKGIQAEENPDISVQLNELREEIRCLREILSSGIKDQRCNNTSRRGGRTRRNRLGDAVRNFRAKKITRKSRKNIRKLTATDKGSNTDKEGRHRGGATEFDIDTLSNDIYQRYLESRKINEKEWFHLTSKCTPALLYDAISKKKRIQSDHASKIDKVSELGRSLELSSSFPPPPRSIVLPSDLRHNQQSFESLDQYFTGSSAREEPNERPCPPAMNIEMLRFETFKRYPLASKARPIRLARSGFFYTGREDRVECYSCGIIYRNWAENDDPHDVHRRLSPECRHVRNQDETNVPIHSEGATPISNGQSDQSPVSSTDTDAQGRTLQTPTTARSRSITTEDPQSASPGTDQTDHLQTSGTRFGITNGYHEESSSSPFASDEGISRSHTERRIPAPLSNGHFSQETSTTSTINAGPSQTPSRQAMIQTSTINAPPTQAPSREAMMQSLEPLGITFDKPRYPSYAVLTIRISSFQNWPPHLTQTPKELALAGFLYAGFEDYVRCFFCGGGLRNWEAGDDPCVEHARWFPKCAFLRQNKGDEFITVVQKQHLGSEKETTQSNSQLNGDQHDANPPSSSETGACHIPDPQGTDETESMLEENRRLKDQRLCKVCLDQDACIAMLPCGHLCCCAECAPAMRKCPICRQFVKGTVRTWLA